MTARFAVARIAVVVSVALIATPVFAQVIVRPPPPPPPPPVVVTPMPQLPPQPTCRQVCMPGVCPMGQVCQPVCTMQCN